MNVLETARHTAGMLVVKRSFFSTLLIAVTTAFAIALVHGGVWWLVVPGAAVFSVLFSVPFAYALGRWNTGLVRRILESIISDQKAMSPLYETHRIKLSRRLEGLTDPLALAELGRQQTIRECEKQIAELYEIDRQSSAAEKLRDQDGFVGLHRSIREQEKWLETLRGASAADYSQYVEEGGLEAMRESLREALKGIDGWIEQSKLIIAEAETGLAQLR